MKLYKIDVPTEREKVLNRLGCDPIGVSIMGKKMHTLLFYLRDLPCGAANILKQDALSVGADLAVPTGVVTCKETHFDAVLMATPRQLETLIKKESKQPFGLKEVAKALRSHLRSCRFSPKIMGVVNANDDSFYPHSRYKEEAAVQAIERMIEEGADMIDIGAVSSRPGSEEVSEDEELARITPILKSVRDMKLYERVVFSVDSYRERVVQKALESGFGVVNDITGLSNEKIGRLAASFGAKVVIMHMQGRPKTMQVNPFYEDVMSEVDDFFSKRIEWAKEMGLKSEAIILDVGIGFGKRIEDNLKLLGNLEHFTHFGCELLIGASRKSMIDKISPSSVEERLPGTLSVHIEALRRGASIIRCHDVKEHRQAIALFDAIERWHDYGEGGQ